MHAITLKLKENGNIFELEKEVVSGLQTLKNKLADIERNLKFAKDSDIKMFLYEEALIRKEIEALESKNRVIRVYKSSL